MLDNTAVSCGTILYVTTKTKRENMLRGYFMQVADDLVRRGVIRRQRGQTLEQVIRAEADTVMREVTADFKAIAVEIGIGAAEAGGRIFARYAENLIGAGFERLGAILKAKR